MEVTLVFIFFRLNLRRISFGKVLIHSVVSSRRSCLRVGGSAGRAFALLAPIGAFTQFSFLTKHAVMLLDSDEQNETYFQKVACSEKKFQLDLYSRRVTYVT